MIDRLFVGACCLFVVVLVGCDSSQPKVTTPEEPPAANADPADESAHGTPTGPPHGMSGMGMPSGMPSGMGDPHARAAMGGMGAPAQNAPELGMEVQEGSIHLTAPEGWLRKRPTSGMFIAQFGLPPVEGDTEEGRLTIMFAGGGVPANINRWRGQYPDGEAPKQVEIAGRKVTMVDFTREPGRRMLGAIIPTGEPNNDCFVKVTGPTKTLGANAEKFRTFIESLRTTGEATPKEPPAETPAETDIIPRGPKPELWQGPEEQPADTQVETPSETETPSEQPAETPSDGEIPSETAE